MEREETEDWRMQGWQFIRCVDFNVVISGRFGIAPGKNQPTCNLSLGAHSFSFCFNQGLDGTHVMQIMLWHGYGEKQWFSNGKKAKHMSIFIVLSIIVYYLFLFSRLSVAQGGVSRIQVVFECGQE